MISTKQLVKGNEAVIYGALMGGATHFFGYPITPASEIAHAAAKVFRETGRHFLQAESEVSVINMLYGASAAGARVMTASSGPGIALMSEGISYMAGAELPGVIVNVQRAGPGLGNIWPEQSDYNMVLKGGGNGNYKNIVLAPNSAQEMCDLTSLAFELSDKYRMVAFILADAYIGQMMEPIEVPELYREAEKKDWALYGDKDSRHNLITSIFMNQKTMEAQNIKLQNKYSDVEKNEIRYEEIETSGAEILIIAYGICARIALTAVRELRKEGIKAGLFRPVSLFPFPGARIKELASSVQSIEVVELSAGMMADDVELAVAGKVPVNRHCRLGGVVPTTSEIIAKIKGGLL